MTTKQTTRKRNNPGPGEMIFQTKHLRRDLHARLHIVKARRNAVLPSGATLTGLDAVLNEVLEAGLEVVEKEERQ